MNRPFKREYNKRTEYPDDVVQSKVLKKSEIAVLLHLARYLPLAFPSIDRLAQDCNLSRETIKRALKALRQYGAIKVVGKGGYHKRANVYVIYDIPEMWAAQTEDEFMGACQLAQQQYEQHKSDNVVDFPQKKESPASVGADAGESAGMKKHIVDSHCTTIPAPCQSELSETNTGTMIESVKAELPWISPRDCERLVSEAKKVIEEEKTVDYIRFCVNRMQAEESKGKTINSKIAYLIGVIRKMREQYRQNERSTAPTKQAQEYEYGDMERLYDELYGDNAGGKDDTDWLYDLTHQNKYQKNDT